MLPSRICKIMGNEKYPPKCSSQWIRRCPRLRHDLGPGRTWYRVVGRNACNVLCHSSATICQAETQKVVLVHCCCPLLIVSWGACVPTVRTFLEASCALVHDCCLLVLGNKCKRRRARQWQLAVDLKPRPSPPFLACAENLPSVGNKCKKEGHARTLLEDNCNTLVSLGSWLLLAAACALTSLCW